MVKVEITSCSNNRCDWDNKIIFALGINDIAKILKGFKNPPSENEKSKGQRVHLVHDPQARSDNSGQTSKVFNITASNPLTAKIINKALLDARVGEGMTMIYCSPYIKAQIEDLKIGNLNNYEGDKNIFQGIQEYNSVPIIPSFSYPYATEALVPAIT